jgi:sporulation protein YlmC with PRC-barrel domain
MERHKDIPTTAEGRLVRLGELKDFQVAEGNYDIRGWHVRTPDGKDVGRVEDLIVDPAERRARYIEVKVDRKALDTDNDRHVLVPIGAVRLKEDGKSVLLEKLPVQGLAGVPEYKGGPITSDYEASLRNYYGATAVNDLADYNRDDRGDDRVDDRKDDRDRDTGLRRGESAERDRDEVSAQPRLRDNEVTVPLVGDQEVVVRRPGTNEEIVIKKNKLGNEEKRD